MNSLSFRKIAATGVLAAAMAFSLTAASHQSGESYATGNKPYRMHQNSAHHDQMHRKHMGMMDRMPMMHEGGHMGMRDRMPMMHEGGYMGMMGHMPMMGGGHMGAMRKYRRLDLSEEQKQKLRSIEHKLHKTHWEIMGQMIDHRAALRDAHAGDRPDPMAIGATYGKIFDLRRQMIEATLGAKNSAGDLLTEAQLAKMKARDHKRRGMKGDMTGCGAMQYGQTM